MPHFNKTFCRAHQKLMKKAMDYVEQKVPCITFRPKTTSTFNFVSIHPGGPGCESELGMVGHGEQRMLLNSECFDEKKYGLLKLVHELLHTLGFVHEQNRPDRDHFINVDLAHSGLSCLIWMSLFREAILSKETVIL